MEIVRGKVEIRAPYRSIYSVSNRVSTVSSHFLTLFPSPNLQRYFFRFSLTFSCESSWHCFHHVKLFHRISAWLEKIVGFWRVDRNEKKMYDRKIREKVEKNDERNKNRFKIARTWRGLPTTVTHWWIGRLERIAGRKCWNLLSDTW